MIETETPIGSSLDPVVMPAVEVLNRKILDGTCAARVLGSDTFYWSASACRNSDSVYLEQEIEGKHQYENGEWSNGHTRTVKRSVRPETLLGVWPLSKLAFKYEDGGWRKTWKLKQA